MKFMITFPLTHRDYKERVSRFLDSGGAPFPEEVKLLGRWFTASHSRGFVLVETSDAKALFRWSSTWSDIVDFQIEPVVTDEEAGGILTDMQA